MTDKVVRQELEEVANNNNLCGDLKITMFREYDEECSYNTEAFKDEIFENSDLSYYIAKVLEHLPITHNCEIYEAYINEYPPDQVPNKYLWKIEGDVLTLAEVNDEFLNDPLYDSERQNVSEIGDPLYDVDLLTEFINENLRNLNDTITWNIQQGDYNTGTTSVSATLVLTIDQIMNLPDYALSGWDYHIQTKTGSVIIEG